MQERDWNALGVLPGLPIAALIGAVTGSVVRVCHGTGRVYRASSQRWPDRPEDGDQAAEVAAAGAGRQRQSGGQVAERSAGKM